MDRERLYMIALMPPGEITREIETIRQEFATYTPRKYKADHIYFWRRRHNGKSWETIATIPLSKNDNAIKQQALF